jgi:hypothetical protein
MLLDIPVHCPFSKFYRPYLHDLNPTYTYKNISKAMDIERWDEPTFDGYDSYKEYTPSLEGKSSNHVRVYRLQITLHHVLR